VVPSGTRVVAVRPRTSPLATAIATSACAQESSWETSVKVCCSVVVPVAAWAGLTQPCSCAARTRMATNCSRVRESLGPKLVALYPRTMPFSAAVATAGAYHAPGATSAKVSAAFASTGMPIRRSSMAVNSARVTAPSGRKLPSG